MSSPCIGCGCSPGPMSIAVMPESRQPRSSSRSAIGSTLGCTGIAWNTGSLASRLYIRRVACPSAAVSRGSTSSSSLEPADRVAQLRDELGLDRVFDDRVAVGVDPREMRGDRGVVESGEGHPSAPHACDPFGESGRSQRVRRARISRMHVLDNPVWHALTGPHATLAERAARAARYQADVSVFGALADDPTPDGVGRPARPGRPGGVAVRRPERARRSPTGWTVEVRAPVPADGAARRPRPTGDRRGRRRPVLVLGAGDVPEMLALVERTRPGPFATRTIELGTYLGIRARTAPRRDGR